MAAEATLQDTPPTVEAVAAPVAASAKPGSPAKGSAAGAKAEKAGTDKKDTKDKKASKAAAVESDGPSVAAHPRAARGVARAKSWGGLLGFLLGGYLSLPTNTLPTAGLRALLAGLACYVAAWAGAVFVWRRLVVLEIRGREQQLLAAAKAASAARALPAPAGAQPSARAGAPGR